MTALISQVSGVDLSANKGITGFIAISFLLPFEINTKGLPTRSSGKLELIPFSVPI